MVPVVAEGASEALALFAKGERFDLAVLDMQMPHMDGIMLATEIQSSFGRLAPPLIMLTSMGRQELSTSGAKFAGQLVKPIKPGLLYSVLLDVIGLSATVRPQLAGENEIDSEIGTRMPLKILLAEDNTVNQRVATLMLKRMGYRADIAANGVEAVAMATTRDYDLVLMDVQMPEMDGLKATHAIHKELPVMRWPRIIAMTAGAMTGDREECLNAGMDDYISKPVKPHELQAALQRCYERTYREVQPL
jgi:CheY-like chemotaxis protein